MWTRTVRSLMPSRRGAALLGVHSAHRVDDLCGPDRLVQHARRARRARAREIEAAGAGGEDEGPGRRGRRAQLLEQRAAAPVGR